jgi:hypothetical protein
MIFKDFESVRPSSNGRHPPGPCGSLVLDSIPPVDGNFLLLRPYHGEHGPKVPVTREYIVLQRVLRKRECISTLTKTSMHLISNDWPVIKAT